MTNFLGKGIEEIAIVIASWRERGRVPFLSKALSLSLSPNWPTAGWTVEPIA